MKIEYNFIGVKSWLKLAFFSTGKPSRLRLFLFLSKPDTVASMGSLLDDAKSETWFVDALNGAGLLPRGYSDPAAVDNLLEPKDGELFQIEKSSGDVDHQVNLTDSPMVETESSIGSSLSSPSVCNLAPIRVRVEYVNNPTAGVEEKLAELNVDGEERCDLGVIPSGGVMTRRPPLPLQPVQRKFGNDAYSLPSPDSKHGGAYGLHSPESITSDGSVASASSKPTLTQDPAQFFPQIQVQQAPNPTETNPNQDQTRHQPYQTRPHYINHPTTTQPVSSYYHPVYAQPPQMDHQPYPLYFLPVTQNHQYTGMQLQTNQTDTFAPPTTASPPLYATQTGVPLTNPNSNQVQQPYMSISQSHIHNPTQMATANGVNYGYEYAYPTQEQVYFTQHQSVASPLGSQYQTVTPGSAMLMTQMMTSQKPAQESAKQ